MDPSDPTDPTDSTDPTNPTDPIDPTLLDFSPGLPITGTPDSTLNSFPVANFTLNYPESGIPAGSRIVVSVYQESPGSSGPGTLVWQRLTSASQGDSRSFTIFTEEPLQAAPDGSITLLVDAVVFNDGVTGNPEVQYAALPRARIEFPAQEQDGMRVYQRIAFERTLEPLTLTAEPSTNSYVQALSQEDPDSNLTIEHSIFIWDTLYLLVNYSDACPTDTFEVEFQVSEADLAAKRIPNGVRRTSPERCSGMATRFLTVSMEGLSDRYAAFHNTVFEPIELEGFGQYRPVPRTYETAQRFGTQPFCDADPSCLASAVLEPNGRLRVLTLGNITAGARYGLSADGETIYLEGDGNLIPPNSFAVFSEDRQSISLSFLGFTFYVQPQEYTQLALNGTVTVPALEAGTTYHAAVQLFTPAETGIDVLARAFIEDFGTGNNSFSIDYPMEGLPVADPYTLQVAAAIFAEAEQPGLPPTLAYRSVYPGEAILFFNESTDISVFESQEQTQLTPTAFAGDITPLVTEVTADVLPAANGRVPDLQFAAIVDNYLHLIIGGQSACQVTGAQFQVRDLPASNVPTSGLPSSWTSGNGAPCQTSTEAGVSIDLKPLTTQRAALNKPLPASLLLDQYGEFRPTLKPFDARRVYADSAECFAQANCLTTLDFKPDGTMLYQRGPITGAATYGVSLDGRTAFSEGIPLGPENTTAFLSQDGQRLTVGFVGQLVRVL